MSLFNMAGLTDVCAAPDDTCFRVSAKVSASAPFMGDFDERSVEKFELRKYASNGGVLKRHWREEFMKHVLPRLLKPTRPRGTPVAEPRCCCAGCCSCA
jgi:hypothetical protein